MNIFRGEVEVSIGGKPRLVKFGTNQLALFTQKHNLALADVSFGMEQIRDLIWSGLVAGAKKQGQEVDFDEWTVGEWIDEMNESEFNKIIEAFNNSMPENKGDSKPGK